jgi:hypothetical protein
MIPLQEGIPWALWISIALNSGMLWSYVLQMVFIRVSIGPFDYFSGASRLRERLRERNSVKWSRVVNRSSAPFASTRDQPVMPLKRRSYQAVNLEC